MKKNGAAAKDDEKLGWKKVKAGLNVERKILQHSVAAVKNYKPGICDHFVIRHRCLD